MKNVILFSLSLILLLSSSCRPDTEPGTLSIDDLLRNQIEERGGLDSYVIPTDLDRIPQDPNNKLTEAKVELGRLLYHETAFSTENLFHFSSESYSCASCHHAKAGFSSGNIQGLGEGGSGFGLKGEARIPSNLVNPMNVDLQPVRTPSILNSAFQELMLWNGQFGGVGANLGTEDQWFEGTPRAINKLGFEGLESQAIASIKVHRMDFNESLIDSYGYGSMFDDVFADIDVEDRYTDTTAALAIAAYQRTILSNQAPFQKWLLGEEMALSEEEKEGALLFFGKAQCYSCHNGPSLASMDFAALGFKDFDADEVFFLQAVNPTINGRASFTGKEDDLYKFKIPQLYNLVDNGFYGHGSSFKSLRAVLEYKNLGLKENPIVDDSQLDQRFKPLNLSERELDLLELFISESLYDPDLMRYVPNAVNSGFCFPNADIQSLVDLGCG